MSKVFLFAAITAVAAALVSGSVQRPPDPHVPTARTRSGDDRSGAAAAAAASSSPSFGAGAVPKGCDLTAPATFSVLFATGVGNWTVAVNRTAAPLGVDRFYSLVKCKYFDGDGFFRVVPGFVTQWGINGNPAVSAQWENANIKDDPVLMSNVRGTIAYADAGPNTRTTQVYVNLGNNARLDPMGFTPFGTISDSDMVVFEKIYAGYGEQPDQDQIYAQGNAYLKKDFPKLTFTTTATIVA